MSYKYKTICDFCHVEYDDWNGVPPDWVVINNERGTPEHACAECWEKVLKVLKLEGGAER